MRGIVRKRLVALLSLAGFAGSTASATAQVLKGSDETTKTKAESTIKSQKNVKENHSGAAQSAIKLKKNAAAQYPIEHGKEASLTNNKTDARWKQSKNTAESKATRNAICCKSEKTAPGSAAQSGASNKVNQGSPK